MSPCTQRKQIAKKQITKVKKNGMCTIWMNKQKNKITIAINTVALLRVALFSTVIIIIAGAAAMV